MCQRNVLSTHPPGTIILYLQNIYTYVISLVKIMNCDETRYCLLLHNFYLQYNKYVLHDASGPKTYLSHYLNQ